MTWGEIGVACIAVFPNQGLGEKAIVNKVVKAPVNGLATWADCALGIVADKSSHSVIMLAHVNEQALKGSYADKGSPAPEVRETVFGTGVFPPFSDEELIALLEGGVA